MFVLININKNKMKLDTFEWFKKNNPHLVDKNIKVVSTTDHSTILFINSFDNIYLSDLKRSDQGLLALVSGRIAKVTGGYEIQLYISNMSKTGDLLKIDDMDKIKLHE